MNFSVHLQDKIVERLDRAAKETGKKRNALIREAVSEWLDERSPAKWPEAVMKFRGIRGIKRFESYRSELQSPRDPFDATSA